MSKPTVTTLSTQLETLVGVVNALTAKVESAVRTAQTHVEQPAAQRAPKPIEDLDAYCARYAPNLAARSGDDFLRYLDKVAAEHGYRVAYHLHKAARRLQQDAPKAPPEMPVDVSDDIPF